MSDAEDEGVGRIEVGENGGARFAGDCGILPAMSLVYLGELTEKYPLDEIPEGTTLGTFPKGDPEEMDLRTPEEIREAIGG